MNIKISVTIFLLILILSNKTLASTYNCTKISVIDQRGYMTDPHWKLKYTSHVEGDITFHDTSQGVFITEKKKIIQFSPWKYINSEMKESRNGNSIIIKRIYKNELTFYFVDSNIPIDKEIRYLNPSHMFRLSECVTDN